MLEMGKAICIARDLIVKGERGTAEGGFIEDLMKRLAETVKRGEFDAGAMAVDDALANCDRKDGDHSLPESRKALLEAGIALDQLRRDSFAVARRVEALAALDTPDTTAAWSQTYWHWFNAFLSEGQIGGINFSLEVAIEMARRMAETARDGDQRGAAHILLGNALRVLGSRESGTARLEAAAAAYREALKEWTRERAPRDWAATQMNLGAALATLGEREGGTARLVEAIAAYREP